MAKKGMMTVKLNEIPLKGKAKELTVEVPMTQTTLGELAKTLSLDLKNRTVTVDGKVATADTVVTPNAYVALRVTERPQGS